MNSRDELRDELMAVLGAARELPPDTDAHLAEVFADQIYGNAQARPPRRRPFPGAMRRSRRALAALVIAASTMVVGLPVSLHFMHPDAQALACTRDTFFPVLYHSKADFQRAAAGAELQNNHLALAKELHMPGYKYSLYVFWDHANCTVHR